MATYDTFGPARYADAEGQPLDVTRVADALAGLEGADDWQAEVLRDAEAQLYLIGTSVESRRQVRNERARAVLYNDHPARGDVGDIARGATALTLTGEDVGDHGRLIARLRDAVTMAGLTDNRPFDLPAPPADGYPGVEASDPSLGSDLHDLPGALEEIRARLEDAVALERGVRLSSAEFYATRHARELRTSRGIAAEDGGTTVALDLVLIAGDDDGREAEFHAELTRRRVEDLRIEETVAAYAAFARHALVAATPPTARGPIILSGEALAQLFGPLVFHASAQAAYQHVSRFRQGEPIVRGEVRGDALTLLGDGLRPYGVGTRAFDGEGIASSCVTVVRDGVFVAPWADARYAAYLGVRPTGAFANPTIQRGTASLADLRAGDGGRPIYEIVSFSWLNPDPLSGAFASEIRLGYRHDAHGTTPIKGGTLSGNLFDALADVRLSAEAYSDGSYFGPAAIRFGELSIAGA